MGRFSRLPRVACVVLTGCYAIVILDVPWYASGRRPFGFASFIEI